MWLHPFFMLLISRHIKCSLYTGQDFFCQIILSISSQWALKKSSCSYVKLHSKIRKIKTASSSRANHASWTDSQSKMFMLESHPRFYKTGDLHQVTHFTQKIRLQIYFSVFVLSTICSRQISSAPFTTSYMQEMHLLSF